MKTLATIITVFLLVNILSAQENTMPVQDSSKIKMTLTKSELKKAKLEEEFNATSQMIENRNFVLEANYLGNQRGNRIVVNSTFNFIRVDSIKAVIQVGSDTRLGYNGVGGITTEGEITGWKLDKNFKKKSFYLSMSVITNLGIYDIRMDVDASGNATAYLSGLQRGQLIYEGNLVPIEESRVYKGHPSY